MKVLNGSNLLAQIVYSGQNVKISSCKINRFTVYRFANCWTVKDFVMPSGNMACNTLEWCCTQSGFHINFVFGVVILGNTL